MKKTILLLSIFALTLVTIGASVSALETCSAPGGGCPSSCLSSNAACTPKPQTVPAPNVPGKELTCIKQTNVGCGFFLEFPPIKGNECPSGMTHDDVIDGAIDCGFLGLGVIFGDTKSVCHQNVDVACKANAKCPAGTKPKPVSEKSCFVSSGQSTNQVLQCCNLNVPTAAGPVEQEVPQDAEEVVDEREGLATSIVINERDVIVSNSGEFTFTFRATNRLGAVVTNTTSVNWSISGGDTRGNAITTNPDGSGLFVACADCSGSFQVNVNGIGGYEKHDDVQVTVIGIRDLRIEPSTRSAESGARLVLQAKATSIAQGSEVDLPVLWTAQGANILFPNIGTANDFSIVQIIGNAGQITNVTGSNSGLSASSAITVVETRQDRIATLITGYADRYELAKGDTTQIGYVINGVDGVAINRQVSFTSNATRVATVNRTTGLVTAVNPGDVKITITSGPATTDVYLHVVECFAAVACFGGEDQRGPTEKLCVEGRLAQECTPQQCDPSGPGFRCTRPDVPVGKFTCNAETLTYDVETCNPIEIGAPNAASASLLSGVICASQSMPLPTADELNQIAQNVQQADNVIQEDACRFYGKYANDVSCIKRGVVTLDFTFGPEGRTANSTTVGDWSYEIGEASIQSNSIQLKYTNVNGEIVNGPFITTGSTSSLNADLTVQNVQVEETEDGGMHATAQIQLEYNSCRYTGPFDEIG